MLGHSGLAELKAFHQLAHGSFAVPEKIENGLTVGLAENLESGERRHHLIFSCSYMLVKSFIGPDRPTPSADRPTCSPGGGRDDRRRRRRWALTPGSHHVVRGESGVGDLKSVELGEKDATQGASSMRLTGGPHPTPRRRRRVSHLTISEYQAGGRPRRLVATELPRVG